MARIAGIDLPRNKRGVIGLTYIYGIGPSTAKKLLDDVGIDQEQESIQMHHQLHGLTVLLRCNDLALTILL